MNTGCSPENQPNVMDDIDEWGDRVREIYVSGMT